MFKTQHLFISGGEILNRVPLTYINAGIIMLIIINSILIHDQALFYLFIVHSEDEKKM